MGVLLGGLFITIGIPCGSPVKCGSELVVAASFTGCIITTRLHDIDLAGRGPATIG